MHTYEVCVVKKKHVNDIVHFTPVTCQHLLTWQQSSFTVEHSRKYVYPQNITLHFVLPTKHKMHQALTVGGFNETLCLVELQTPAFISLAFTAMMKCPLMDQKLLHRPFFTLTNHAWEAFRI